MSADTFCSRRPSCAPARRRPAQLQPARRVRDLGAPPAARSRRRHDHRPLLRCDYLSQLRHTRPAHAGSRGPSASGRVGPGWHGPARVCDSQVNASERLDRTQNVAGSCSRRSSGTVDRLGDLQRVQMGTYAKVGGRLDRHCWRGQRRRALSARGHRRLRLVPARGEWAVGAIDGGAPSSARTPGRGRALGRALCPRAQERLMLGGFEDRCEQAWEAGLEVIVA
jgi:hypothetical protein